ncbi:MAG: nitroreductase family protein, partial [Sediminibacterium sp.]|nr:nitroreductase family protein [Sediminibacterium sp.]
LLCLTMKTPLTIWSSEYLSNFMKDVQGLSDEAIQPRLKIVENFQKSDFDLSDDRKLFDWAAKQSYIALGNMMTSAAMIGIDSCPIEGFKRQETESILQNHFDIDTTKFGLSYMVAFGYRITEPRAKTRRKIEQIITWM